MGDDILGDDDNAILGEDDVILGADGEEYAVLGYDEDGNAIMGATRRRGRPARRPAPRRIAGPTGGGVKSAPSLVSKVPGIDPSLSRAKLPLGLPLAAFVPAGVTIQNVNTQPQKPVLPKRLIIGVTGVNAGNYAVRLVDLRIGTQSILASADGVDARAFTADAVGVQLQTMAAQPGITITATYAVTPVVGVGDSVNVQTTIICDSLT